jgi:BirA family transcriptional regulator, biotin operon repressor / biotin---[acetyl-CoA-carboxylase] ligase
VIAPDEIRIVPSRLIGREIRRFGTVSSTNDLAISADAPDGTAFVADHQSNGRGQHGRVWTSRAGDSLLVSIKLRPPTELARPVILTALAAVAVGDAIRELAGVQSRIKWPNDLLIHGKKVCGILIEAGRATVIGIGLNLNQSTAEFALAGLPDATSLHLAGDRRVDRDAALDTVLTHLDREWERLLAGERVPLESDWKWRIGLLGRSVVVERSDGNTVSGRLLEMGFDALELLHDDGTAEAIQPELVRHIHVADTQTSNQRA